MMMKLMNYYLILLDLSVDSIKELILFQVLVFYISIVYCQPFRRHLARNSAQGKCSFTILGGSFSLGTGGFSGEPTLLTNSGLFSS